MSRVLLREDTRRRGYRATVRQYRTSLSPLRKPRWAAIFALVWFTSVVTSPGFLAIRMQMAASQQASGGAVFEVGSFTKRSGASGTGTQTVTHSLGQAPKAAIFFTSGSDAAGGTWDPHITQCVGFTDGTNSYTLSGAVNDNVGTSDTGRRIANQAITLIDENGSTIRGEASMQSWSETNFVLNWFVNDSVQPLDAVICYLLIGGSNVQAKALAWQTPNVTGNHPVTGVGFRPDVALHAMTKGSVGSSATHHIFGFGVMDASGNQWMNALLSEDAGAVSNTYRYQRVNKCIGYMEAGAVQEEASFVSMNADGFTLNFSSAQSSTETCISLCLRGVTAVAGSFTGSGALGSQTITGIGFRGKAILTCNASASSANSTPGSNAYWAMSATDGTRVRGVAQVDRDASDPTQADSYFDDGPDSFILEPALGPTFVGVASFTGFTNTGFTISWGDAANNTFPYLVLA